MLGNVANRHGCRGSVFEVALDGTEAEAVPPFFVAIGTLHLAG